MLNQIIYVKLNLNIKYNNKFKMRIMNLKKNYLFLKYIKRIELSIIIKFN